MPVRARRARAGCASLALLAGAMFAIAARPASAVPIAVQYGDGPDEGFNDAARGGARRAAMELAASVWAATLGGSTPVVVRATMDPLGGTGTGAVLASTAATTLHRNFPGALRTNTWYAAALANQLAGTDVNGAGTAEIDMTFNSDVDGPTVLGSVGFYYGTDGVPSSDIDFATIALHELGHGLGFFDTVSPSSGNLVFVAPGIYDTLLARPGLGSFATMLRAERLAAITSGEVVWTGQRTLAFNGSAPRIYAPGTYQSGSSLSHWDVSFAPDELMEPFYTAANHDPALLLPALADMGWQLAVPSFTPRATPAPDTPTRTPRPTLSPTPAGSPAPLRALAYVSNFDDATMSVIEVSSNTVIDTIAVDDGPTGIAASADGRRVYVANFHSATLGVIDTGRQAMIDAIPVGGSANGVALAPDGVVAYVTDTFRDTVSVVDLVGGAMIDTIPVGPQPAGIAIDVNRGRALVANFGGRGLSVIDTASNQLIATLAVADEPPGVLAVAVRGRGFVTTSRFGTTGAMFLIDTGKLLSQRFSPGEADAVAIHPAGSPAYAAMRDSVTGAGRVALIDVDSLNTIRSIGVGRVPEALQVTPDGAWLYVANAGSNTVSVIDTARERVVATIAVGAAPMGIAVVEVPMATPSATPTAVPCAGDCDGDGQVTVAELVRAVALALGVDPLSLCPTVDLDQSGNVTVNELVTATRGALQGCP